METHRPLPVFQCFACLGSDSGPFWGGSGCVSPSQRQRTGEVESTAEHSNWTLLRQEKIMDVSVVIKKGKYSPSEVKHQAGKTCSRTKVNL